MRIRQKVKNQILIQMHLRKRIQVDNFEFMIIKTKNKWKFILVYCNTIFSIIFGLLTFLPIITLLMGIFYFDKCNMEPYIPLWLIGNFFNMIFEKLFTIIVYYYFIPLFKVTGVIGIYILSKRIISSWLKAFKLVTYWKFWIKEKDS